MEDYKQERNERCGCGSGKKHKKCCGRFSLHEMTAKLTAYVEANRRKDQLIRRSLRFLESRGGDAILCLVNPKPDSDDVISWTQVDNKTPVDEREAVVTRRILAGYLPVCALVADKEEASGWQAVIDAAMVGEEVRGEFVAFARLEAATIVGTMNGEIDPYDSWMTAVPWEDRSYPGMPIKPRPATTIRIEVNVAKRGIRTIWGHYGAMDFSIPESHYTEHGGMNDVEFALAQANDIVEALSQTSPPKQLVEGDRIELYLDIPDSEMKLLAAANVKGYGLEGTFGQGGAA